MLMVWSGLGRKKHWVRFQKRSCFWLKIPALVITNKDGEVLTFPYKKYAFLVSNMAFNIHHPPPHFLTWGHKHVIWMWYNRLCRGVDMACHFLSWRLGWLILHCTYWILMQLCYCLLVSPERDYCYLVYTCLCCWFLDFYCMNCCC